MASLVVVVVVVEEEEEEEEEEVVVVVVVVATIPPQWLRLAEWSPKQADRFRSWDLCFSLPVQSIRKRSMHASARRTAAFFLTSFVQLIRQSETQRSQILKSSGGTKGASKTSVA